MDTAQRGHGARLADLARAHHGAACGEARGIPGAIVFSGAGTDHLPPGANLHARRRRRRVRGTVRRDRGGRGPHHPDGEPRAGRLRALARRLPAGLRTRAVAGARAGHPALAGRDVRPGARRLLDRRRRPRERPRSRPRHRSLRRGHRRQRGEGGRRQGVAARQGQGGGAALAPAAGRPHVHRRRLQLRRADRRRRERPLRRAARDLRRRSRLRRPPRSTALAAGDRARFDAILAPTVPLSRHVFAAPTRFYKTGVVFLAWLNGHQAHFTMVGGQQSARSLCTWPSCSGSPMPPDCCATRSSRPRGCAPILPSTASKPESRTQIP